MAKFYDFEAIDIHGKVVPMENFVGKMVLVVNVASECGLTPQYEGLESLYKIHGKDKLEILGFPCNQFGAQEPGTDAEILDFCQSKFNVTFPMFSKVNVNGPDAHPLFQFLKNEIKDEESGEPDIQWNFNKFLVNYKGEVVARFSPKTSPDELASELVRFLP